jgi:hypothetical protein
MSRDNAATQDFAGRPSNLSMKRPPAYLPLASTCCNSSHTHDGTSTSQPRPFPSWQRTPMYFIAHSV